MTDDAELSYTTREVRSFLPMGWSLGSRPDNGWTPERRTWIAVLRDGSGLAWEVEVDPDLVSAHGRMEALRRAMAAVRSRKRSKR